MNPARQAPTCAKLDSSITRIVVRLSDRLEHCAVQFDRTDHCLAWSFQPYRTQAAARSQKNRDPQKPLEGLGAGVGASGDGCDAGDVGVTVTGCALGASGEEVRG